MEMISTRYDSAVDVVKGTGMGNEAAELRGACEAVARLALLLTAQLEDRGLIDGPALTKQLRETAAALTFPGEHREPARRRLMTLADDLDQARCAR